MHELSTTPLPAYGKHSTVTAVREEAPMPEAQAPDTRDSIDLAPIQDRLDALETRMTERTAPAPRTLHVREAFVLQLQQSAESRRLRALADVVSSGNAGVLPPAWSSEVVSYVDSMRYLIPRVGSMGVPRHRAQPVRCRTSASTPSSAPAAPRRPRSLGRRSPPTPRPTTPPGSPAAST